MMARWQQTIFRTKYKNEAFMKARGKEYMEIAKLMGLLKESAK